MEQRLTPEVFSGSAIAALCGLVSGLMLHAGWRRHPGGPQIQYGAAQAAERPAPAASTPAEPADLDAGDVEPAPLPVVRLAPDMFEVRPAAADETERQDVDKLVVDAEPPAPPHDPD